MPPRKKTVPDGSSNANNNTNNNVVNVNVKQPRAPRKKTAPKKKEEPNWVTKALVIALIGAAVSFLFYQLQKEADGGERPRPGSLGPVTRDN